MSDTDKIELVGEVLQNCGNGWFSVRIDDDMRKDEKIMCTVTGKIRKNAIKILPGDRVKVLFSPYDLTRGMISYRMKG